MLALRAGIGLGEVLGPKPGPQEAPRGPKTAKNTPYNNPGTRILRVSMGRSGIWSYGCGGAGHRRHGIYFVNLKNVFSCLGIGVGRC